MREGKEAELPCSSHRLTDIRAVPSYKMDPVFQANQPPVAEEPAVRPGARLSLYFHQLSFVKVLWVITIASQIQPRVNVPGKYGMLSQQLFGGNSVSTLILAELKPFIICSF